MGSHMVPWSCLGIHRRSKYHQNGGYGGVHGVYKLQLIFLIWGEGTDVIGLFVKRLNCFKLNMFSNTLLYRIWKTFIYFTIFKKSKREGNTVKGITKQPLRSGHSLQVFFLKSVQISLNIIIPPLLSKSHDWGYFLSTTWSPATGLPPVALSYDYKHIKQHRYSIFKALK